MASVKPGIWVGDGSNTDPRYSSLWKNLVKAVPLLQPGVLARNPTATSGAIPLLSVGSNKTSRAYLRGASDEVEGVSTPYGPGVRMSSLVDVSEGIVIEPIRGFRFSGANPGPANTGAVLFTWDGTTGDERALLSQDGTDALRLRISNASPGNLQVTDTNIFTSAIVANRWYLVFVDRGLINSNQMFVHLFDMSTGLVRTGLTNRTIGALDTNPIYIGAQASNDPAVGVTIAGAWFWDRDLSFAEMRLLVEDPFAMFRPSVIEPEPSTAVVRTGSVTTIQSAISPASQSVTVPEDAELVVVSVGGYENVTNVFSSGTVTLGGQALSVADADGDASTADTMAVQFYRVNPLTGSQSLVWTWVGEADPDAGAVLHVSFYKGLDTASPIRWSGATQNDDSIAATAFPGDMVVAVGASEDSAHTWTNATEAADTLFNNEVVSLAEVAATGDVTVSFDGATFPSIAALTLRVAPPGPGPGITIVGTAQAGSNNSGNDVTITFNGSPQEGDFVLLVGGNGQSDANEPFGPVTAGYTTITTKRAAADQGSLGAWYKFLTSTPDTTVVGEGGGDATDGVAYACIVLRGVDPINPLDALTTETGPTETDAQINAAITTATNGAWVIVAASNGLSDDVPNGGPDFYRNLAAATAVDTNRYAAALATREIVTAGLEEPTEWNSWTIGWFMGITIAIRPATYSDPPVFDAATEFATFTTTSPATVSHSPVGTPRGVLVEVDHGEVATDLITGVTYGGVAMTRVATSTDDTDEPGRVYLYFLGASIPTGSQTVSIAHTGTATVKHATVATVIASGDTEIGSAMGDFISGTVATPSMVAFHGDRTALSFMVAYSGLPATTDLTAISGMTAISDHDFGEFVTRFDRQTMPAPDATLLGYSAAADDSALAYVTIQLVGDSDPYIQGSAVPRLLTNTTTFYIRMAGDLADRDMFAFAISRDSTSGSADVTCTDDSGVGSWTLLTSDSDKKLWAWWKRGTAADVGARLTIADAVGSVTGGLVWTKNTNGAAGNPVTDVSLESNASGDETHAGFTPTNDGSIIFFVVGDYTNDTNTVTNMAAATLGVMEPKWFEAWSTGGSDCLISVTARYLPSGATGDFTWSQSNTTTKSVVFAVAPLAAFVASLYATATQTISDVVDETDATSNLHESIDDDPASPNDADWINNTDDAGEAWFDLTDLPGDFGTMDSIEVVVRWRGQNFGTGTVELYARIYEADETTPLTDEELVATATADTSFANTSPVTFSTVEPADKTTWDGARLRLRWASS